MPIYEDRVLFYAFCFLRYLARGLTSLSVCYLSTLLDVGEKNSKKSAPLSTFHFAERLALRRYAPCRSWPKPPSVSSLADGVCCVCAWVWLGVHRPGFSARGVCRLVTFAGLGEEANRYVCEHCSPRLFGQLGLPSWQRVRKLMIVKEKRIF